MGAQSLDYVIIFGQGIIIALLGYNFMAQGRNLLAPEDRGKSASQMIRGWRWWGWEPSSG
jgi:hypothetical protein